MPDMEKVIKGLENIVSDMQEEIDEWRDYSDSELSHGLTCDCEWWYNTAQMLKDALTLLKAQEPKPPVVKENSYGWKFYYCPSCGKEFYQNNKFSFCEKCGQAVKWDG